MDVRTLARSLEVIHDDVASLVPADIDWDRLIDDLQRLDYASRVAVAWMISAASAGPGECRVNGLSDVRQVFPVLEDDGLHWECSHPRPHRSQRVAALKP